ncbi:hypothetical protein V490_01717 [Pseudogymnoascus sp. VKM F-3557]|nr:hypothetical protein V490_01717 [Pseudogymnoascus sp. VKM F-3557]
MGIFSKSKRSSDLFTDDKSGFIASSELQVEAIGYDLNQALCGRTLENIFVYRPGSPNPKYASMRLKKSSNSCALIRGNTTLISTIYRWGPGRHPRMRILNSSVSIEEAIEDDNVRGELVEVKSRSIVSRGQVFDTSLGKFEWRYGTRDEQAACDADSLLVMEENGKRIGLFVRNDQFRTPGTRQYSGGNGGRLMLDLRICDNPESVEAFAVASCILMLKREADRFIENNVAAVV